ncbi:MAG: HAD family hydrolase [Clostridia bacterium]|nr:HAD family hydrolase [Clostridia bacterium]
MGQPQLIIWDWNGTIMDDMEFTYWIENKMLLDRGLKSIPDRAFYLDNFGFPIIEYYRKLGYDFSVYPYEELAAEFHDLYAEGYQTCPLKAGVLKMLKDVQERGIPQTLLSASEQSRLLEQTSFYGVGEYFGELLGVSDDFATSKVDRAKAYIRDNHFNLNEVIFIGDTDHDYEAANAVGCKCILMTGGHQSRKRLEACGVPVVDTFDELRALLFSD